LTPSQQRKSISLLLRFGVGIELHSSINLASAIAEMMRY
jgi:hypothetical protein